VPHCLLQLIRSDQILQAAEKRNGPTGPASTAAGSPAATRPPLAQLQRPGRQPQSAPSPIRPSGGGIASTAPQMRPGPPPSRPGPGIASTSSLPAHPASNLAQTYRQNPPPRMNSGPAQGMGPGSYRGAPPPQQQQMQMQMQQPQYGAGPGPGYDPRRGPPPMQGPPQPQGPSRNVMRAPPAGAGGRRF
jgi:hypothetical protein